VAIPQEGLWPTETDKDRIWELTQADISRQSRRAHRRKISALAGTAILALGIGATAIILPATHIQPEVTVRCYIGQSATSEFSTVADGKYPDDGNAAVAGCATAQYYEKTKSSPIYEASKKDGEPSGQPPFAACRQPDGVVAVFPLTTSTGSLLTPEALCRNLDLPSMSLK